jgi:hypothetical protein
MQSDERQIRRIMGRFYRPWYQRPIPWLFLLLVVLAGGRLALTPLADRWVKESLGELSSFHAEYRDLSLFSFPPVAVVDGLTVDSHEGQPVAAVERLELHTSWRELLRAALFDEPAAIRMRISRPRLTLTGDAPVFLADEARTWLEGRTRLRVQLAAIEDGAIQMGAVGSARSETWMNKIRATVTREISPAGATMVVKGTAALLGSGDTAFKISQPEGENQPASGELQVNYLSLADLYLFLDGTPPAKDLAQGTLAVAARFKVDGPEVTGVLRTSSAGVRASDLPAPLVERLRVRLSAAAPFIEARRRSPADPAEFALRGTVSPAGSGGWLKAMSAARAFFVEGVGGAVAALSQQPEATSGASTVDVTAAPPVLGAAAAAQ